MGTMVLLDETGDTTITWDDDTNPLMKELIEKKLAEGYSFFIIKPTFIPFIKRTVKVKSAHEIKNSMVIKDAELARLFNEGKVEMAKQAAQSLETTKRSKDPDEIANSATVAVKPMRGG